MEYFEGIGYTKVSNKYYRKDDIKWNVLKFTKDTKEGHCKLDIILIGETPWKTPEEFIEHEFDLDIVKVWFNGTIFGSPDMNETFRLFSEKKFTVESKWYVSTACDFTMTRVRKYASRGFSYIENEDFNRSVGMMDVISEIKK